MQGSARELLVPFFTPLVWWDRDSTPGPPTPKEDGLPTVLSAVPRFTGKTRITGKTTEIPERPKNNREILICPSPIKKAIIDY